MKLSWFRAVTAIRAGQPVVVSNRETWAEGPGRTEQAGRVPIIEVIVCEEVTMWTAALLHTRLDEALLLRPTELVVDLAGCPHLDAAGIGMLLQVHRRARQLGTQLILRAPTSRVRRNLALARVDHVLQVSPPGPERQASGGTRT